MIVWDSIIEFLLMETSLWNFLTNGFKIHIKHFQIVIINIRIISFSTWICGMLLSSCLEFEIIQTENTYLSVRCSYTNRGSVLFNNGSSNRDDFLIIYEMFNLSHQNLFTMKRKLIFCGVYSHKMHLYNSEWSILKWNNTQ